MSHSHGEEIGKVYCSCKEKIPSRHPRLNRREPVFEQRVQTEDRLQWKKIHKTDVLEDTLNKYDFSITAPVTKNLIVDNTHLSAEQVVEKIIEFLN